MTNPNNGCHEEEEGKKEAPQPESEEGQQEQQRSEGSSVPCSSTAHTVEIQSTEDEHSVSRADDNPAAALTNTPTFTEPINRIRPSVVQRRSSRVRFSLDTENRPLPQNSQPLRSSLDIRDRLKRDDGSSRNDMFPAVHSRNGEKEDESNYLRLRRPSMSIQTNAPATGQSAQALTSTKTPPARLEPLSSTSGDGVINQIPATKTRNRGYSLRRIIFNRNINPTEEEPASESVELSPKQRSSHNYSQSTGTDSRFKRDETVTSAVHSPVGRQHVKPHTRKSGKFRGAVALVHHDSYLWKKAKQTYLFRELRSVFQRVRKLISRINEIPSSKDGRHIPLDVSGMKVFVDERTGKPYISNSICSTRYSLWNFLPRQLVAQFSKLANL